MVDDYDHGVHDEHHNRHGHDHDDHHGQDDHDDGGNDDDNKKPGGNSLSSGSASQTLNLEELVWAALDLHLLAEWINKYFVTSVIVALKPQPGQVERQTDVVKSCFDKQVSSTLSVVPIIWNKI